MRISADKSQLKSTERLISAELKTLLNELGSKLLPLDKISLSNDFQLTLKLSQALLGGNTLKLGTLPPELSNAIISNGDSIKLAQEGSNLRLSFLSGQSAKPQTVASLLFGGNIQKTDNQYHLKTLISVIDNSNSTQLSSSQLANKTVDPSVSQPTNRLQELITTQLRQYTTPPAKLNESVTALNLNLNKLVESFSLVEVNTNSNGKYALKEMNTEIELPLSNQIQKRLKTGSNAQLFNALTLLAKSENKNSAQSLVALKDLASQLTSIVKPENKTQSLSIAHRLSTSGSQLESKLGAMINILEKNSQSKQHVEKQSNVTPASSRNAQTEETLQFTKNKNAQNMPLATDLKLVAKQLQSLSNQALNSSESASLRAPGLLLALKPIFEYLVKNLDQNLLSQNINRLASDSVNKSNLNISAQSPQQLSTQQSTTIPLSVAQNIQALITPIISEFFSTQGFSRETVSTSMLQSLSRAVSDILSQFTTLNSGLKFVLDPKLNEQLRNFQRPIFEQIARQSESIIQRIEYNQLVSARSDFGSTPSFLVDLPIMHLGKIDSFELLIENHKRKQDREKTKIWKITVRFDLSPLGAMFARLTFKDNQLTTDIFAKEKDTAELVNQHLDKLNESLFSAGINVASLSGQQGLVPESLEPQDSDGISVRV